MVHIQLMCGRFICRGTSVIITSRGAYVNCKLLENCFLKYTSHLRFGRQSAFRLRLRLTLPAYPVLIQYGEHLHEGLVGGGVGQVRFVGVGSVVVHHLAEYLCAGRRRVADGVGAGFNGLQNGLICRSAGGDDGNLREFLPYVPYHLRSVCGGGNVENGGSRVESCLNVYFAV